MSDARDFLNTSKRIEGAATEGPWEARTSEVTMNDRSEWRIGHPSRPKVLSAVMATVDAEFIAHARTTLPKMRAALEAVLEIHRRAHAVFSWQAGLRYEEPCPECDGKSGVHECGCWADQDIEYVCAECHRLGSGSSGIYDYVWPCPTVRAIESALTEGDPNDQ